MPDMLVKLYELPPLQPYLDKMAGQGVQLRRGLPPEKHNVLKWVGEHFSPFWVSETDVAFGHQPPGVFVATENDKLLGFACIDATARGVFGPTGVDEATRGRGIGAALLLIALHDMRARGYAYGVIGGAGPTEFYAKIVGAVEIPDSWPGLYTGLLRA
jgi:GNAT superfamily N-acetyltransferase